ncbi:MAG: hypothetical protein P1P84_18810 [Deferrisomatales bacterium]|nr:hypothetical protein [Deferrisomatales bacterium]
MSAMAATDRDTTLRLEGEVGRDRTVVVMRDLRRALQSCGGEVWLDLGSTRHLHYEVARVLVQAASSERRLHLVGATPYVRQILQLVGGIEAELPAGLAVPTHLADAVA